MKKIAIVGGGSSGLISAYFLAKQDFQVTVYEQKKQVGRKFLVAGEGGLNLSNNAEHTLFKDKFSHIYIRNCIDNFNLIDLRNWLNEVNVKTYFGSSGKLFPVKELKPAEVLKCIKDALIGLNVSFECDFKLIDFSEKELTFESNIEIVKRNFDFAIFALGGKSWQKTGSDGKWQGLFKSKNIEIAKFQPSNAGFVIDWNEETKKLKGLILKNCLLTLGVNEKKGDLTIKEFSLEGTPVYWLNNDFRNGDMRAFICLFPEFSKEQLKVKLAKEKTNSESLKIHLKCDRKKIQFIKANCSKEIFLENEKLAEFLLNIPLEIKSLSNIDEAISTIGGVSWSSMDANCNLKLFPTIYLSGEMLDWDCPTGGYLLHGCFASGRMSAQQIIDQFLVS